MSQTEPQVLLQQSATAQEAAAIVAALQRFNADHAPLAANDKRALPTAWQRAALLEGTGRAPDGPSPWGDPALWGAPAVGQIAR